MNEVEEYKPDLLYRVFPQVQPRCFHERLQARCKLRLVFFYDAAGLESSTTTTTTTGETTGPHSPAMSLLPHQTINTTRTRGPRPDPQRVDAGAMELLPPLEAPDQHQHWSTKSSDYSRG